MDAPSMVQRTGDTLIVRSVVSGDQIYLNESNQSTGTGTGGTQTTTSIPNASSTSTSATGTLCGRQQQFQQQQQQHQLHQQTLNDFEVLQNGCLNLKHSTDKYNTLAYDNNCNELNDADDDSAEDNDNGATGIDDALPQCKIKRNYSCNNCTYFTQNPRHFLMHLRDIHGEKIVINECKHCLYASRHYQKLVRHMKMVHGSTEGLEEQAQSRKRATQLARELRKRKATSDEQHQQQQQQTVQMLQTNQQNMIGSQLSRKLHEYPSQLNPGVGSSPSSSSSLLLAGGTLLQVNNNPNSGDSPIPGDGAGSSSSSTGSVSGGGLLGIASLHPSSPLNSPGTGGNMAGLGSGGNKLLKCTLCDYTALYRQQLLDHEREEHIKTKFFRCEKCSYVTHIKARFSKHVKYHSMPMIKCVKCDFRTPYKWNLDRHMKNHGGTGTFKCSACDFTADIKQSLTVHEMNHHIPPVGNAGNTGIARRRNKVGGTDLPDDYPSNYYGMESNDGSYSEFPLNNNTIDDLDSVGGVSGLAGSIKVKSEPDLIYQTEPADLSQKPYGNCNSPPQKKAKRPVPKLIPIQPTSTQVSPQFNEKSLMEKFTNFMNFGQFCAQMNTSSLKDLASCFISEEEVIQSSGGIDKRADTPQLSPSSTASSSTRRKNANIFNELKNKLGTGQTGNLQCNCGHVSKCLSESIIHQKACRKSIDENHHFTHSPVNLKINTGSTRCQYCRHRCKSSADLVAHMQNCLEARSVCDSLDSNSDIGSNNKVEMCEDVTDEAAVDDPNEDPHPMENVVFVWNKIPETSKSLLKTNSVPTTINNNTISNSINDHVPLNDLIVEMKEQGNVLHQKDILSSPTTSSTSQENSYYGVETAPGYGEVTKKMGPEDEDIHSSLKKVFKCPHCSFWASTASRFHVHIVGHLNKKPFECSLCSYRSNWRWDITKHIRLKTIRDPSHKTARVLMNDETGRRNYTKYNKFITLMKVTEEDGDPKLMKSGEMTPSQVASLSFIGSSGNNSIDLTGSPGSNTTKKLNDSSENLLSTVDMHGKFDPSALRIPIFSNEMLANNSPFKPFGLGLNMQSALAAADKNELLNATQIETEDKKPMCFKCKKCNFKNADKEVVLAHVKGHYDDAGLKLDDNKFPIPSMLPYSTLKPTGGVPPIHLNNNSIDMNNLLSAVCMLANNTGGDPKFREQFNAAFGNGGNQLANNGNQKSTSNEYGEMDEASSGVTSAPGWRGPQPYRCGHCQQVSNWKHVIQRHCRLKHNGDIRIEYIEKGSKTNVYKPLVMPNPNPGGANTSSSSSAATTGATGGGICTAAAVNQSSFANLMASGPSNAFNSQLNSDITKNELNLSNTFPSLTNWPCNLCPFTCTTPQELMNHVQHHVPQAGYDFKCTVCSYNSQTMDDLSQHMMLHKNQTIITSTEIEHPQQNRGKRYRCESCPYETDGKSQFNYHSSFHRTRKEALFKCDYCNYSVMKKHLLRQHTRMHLNSEVNSVTSDMASESAEDFDGHSDIMDLRIGGTEIGPSTELYFCSFCPARFASHRDIQLHLKMHFKSYSYKCQYCSYSTTTNLNLNHHDLVHSNLYNLETKKLAGIKINVDYQMPRYDMITGADDTQMECWIVHLEDVIRITNQSLNIDREILENPNEIELFTDNNNQQIRNTQELRERQLNAQRQLNKTNFIKPIGSGGGDTNDRCQHCPYRSDSIEDLKNHMQYHFCVSGIERQVNCNHCDFSAESEYMFKDHIRVHFQFYDQVAFKTKYHNLELYAINENRLSSAGNGGGHNNGQQQTMSTSGGDMSDSDRLSIDSMSSPREQGGHSTLYSDEYDVDVNMHLIDKENKILVDMMKGGDLSK